MPPAERPDDEARQDRHRRPAPADLARLCSTPLRDLHLTIAGTRLEPVLAEFLGELRGVGVHRLQPEFYLSTEWGVSSGTISIAIPFYLASAELTAIQLERMGFVEGDERIELLRYLRHEMGHVVNYAYLLHERVDWTASFGSMEAPYEEEYAIEPFSRRFVLHLPGWYAQKHPDEDWSETFAVWMTPGLDWRKAYAEWPAALAKLELCDRIMTEVNARDPAVTATERDEAVDELSASIDQFYGAPEPQADDDFPAGMTIPLRTLFHEDSQTATQPRPAAALIRHLEAHLIDAVYRWTGHGPESTRGLVRHLAMCAERAGLIYPAEREARTATEVTTLVAAMAMNHTLRGGYLT